MKVKFGKGKTKYGPGVDINLSAKDVALAIISYLAAKDVHISGPMTIRINGELIEKGSIYVDPSAKVVVKGKGYSGDGKKF